MDLLAVCVCMHSTVKNSVFCTAPKTECNLCQEASSFKGSLQGTINYYQNLLGQYSVIDGGHNAIGFTDIPTSNQVKNELLSHLPCLIAYPHTQPNGVPELIPDVFHSNPQEFQK